MKDILTLQDEYILTEDDDILSELYKQLTYLGFFLMKFYGKGKEEDVRDIATDVCYNLKKKKRKIILSYPSRYIANALFFKCKKKTICRENRGGKEDFYEVYYEDLVNDLLGAVEISQEVAPIVEETLRERIPITYMLKGLRGNKRKEYLKVMEEIKEICQ